MDVVPQRMRALVLENLLIGEIDFTNKQMFLMRIKSNSTASAGYFPH